MGGDSIPTGVELVVLPSQIAPDGWVGVDVDLGRGLRGRVVWMGHFPTRRCWQCLVLQYQGDGHSVEVSQPLAAACEARNVIHVRWRSCQPLVAGVPLPLARVCRTVCRRKRRQAGGSGVAVAVAVVVLVLQVCSSSNSGSGSGSRSM